MNRRPLEYQEWLISVPVKAGENSEQAFTRWAKEQGDNIPYVADCGISQNKLWIKVQM